MTCNECQADLSAYVDGELPASCRGELESHLAGCPACRQQLAVLRRLAAGVRELPSPTPPPDFLRAVRATLASPAPRHHWWPAPLGAVSVVAALVVATVLLRPPPTSPPTRSPRELEQAHDRPAVAAPQPAVSKAEADRAAESAVVASTESLENAPERARAPARLAVGRDEAVGAAALPARKEAIRRKQPSVDGKDLTPGWTNGFERVELQLQITPPATEPIGR